MRAQVYSRSSHPALIGCCALSASIFLLKVMHEPIISSCTGLVLSRQPSCFFLRARTSRVQLHP